MEDLLESPNEVLLFGASSSTNEKAKLRMQHMGPLNDLKGIACIIAVFIAFLLLLCTTIYYGIWAQHEMSITAGAINSVMFILLFYLMVMAHLYATFTSPGYMPENYKNLNEQNLPRQFQKLLKLRESIYQESGIKKLMRRSELEEIEISPQDKQKQMAPAEEQSIVTTEMSDTEMSYRSWDKETQKKYKISINDQAFVSNPQEKQQEFRDRVFAAVVKKQTQEKGDFSLGVRRNTYIDKALENQCLRCNSISPPFIHHCKSCGHCIIMMDHHCPWINNCVGIFNQKPFILFTFYSVLCLVYSQILLITHFHEVVYGAQSENLMYSEASFLLTTILIQLGFMLFNLVVFFDQITVVLNRPSPVDRIRMQGSRLKRVKKRGYVNFQTTFGGPFSWRWFLPSPITGQFILEELFY